MVRGSPQVKFQGIEGQIHTIKKKKLIIRYEIRQYILQIINIILFFRERKVPRLAHPTGHQRLRHLLL